MEKLPQGLGLKSLDPLLGVSKQGPFSEGMEITRDLLAGGLLYTIFIHFNRVIQFVSDCVTNLLQLIVLR